jgi:hypothetical protein
MRALWYCVPGQKVSRAAKLEPRLVAKCQLERHGYVCCLGTRLSELFLFWGRLLAHFLLHTFVWAFVQDEGVSLLCWGRGATLQLGGSVEEIVISASTPISRVP